MPSSPARLQNRYELGDLMSERQGVSRHRGIDHTTGHGVVIVSAPVPDVPAAEAAPVAAVVVEDDIMPGFDDDIPVATAIAVSESDWPSIGWERMLLDSARNPVLPRVLDQFVDNNKEYLVLEYPLGTSLWDAWDDPDGNAQTRYGWLQSIAAGLESLHKSGAMFEGIRPDVVVIGENGQPRITDLGDVLPIPVPPGAPIKATLYTAPELILSPESADGRADLYSFGALLYSLEYLHHPLEEKDFERQFTPLQITERFPDVHPLFLRLINKTFCRDLNTRFPSDEMTKTDPTGFHELIKTLGICGRAFDDVRLDIAAWTTTGMVRTGNEDAFTVLHGVDSRQDDLHEYAMVLLCDGMGGYDAGEVAAAITINEMRKYLLAQPMFGALAGKETPKEPVDPKKYQEILRDALKHANKEVYTAARTPGKGKRGMGCTAECVYIDSRNVIAGHVGDSRVYHVHRGRLVQLTRDQTLVNRLVELGQLTAEEAEDHPRKNELQQAIGGQPDVMPGVYAGKLMRGDWVLVCSDGLSNHITNKELETMLTREAANSAEEAARRLLNLVNLRGATDNATIVVVRAS
jgi:PPM family protein phosphatase